MNKIERRRCR